MARIEKGEERVKIIWPIKGKVFTVKDVFELNKINGKPTISAVAVQVKIKNLLEKGDVVTYGELGTKGRPKVLYKFIVDPPNQPKSSEPANNLNITNLISQSININNK